MAVIGLIPLSPGSPNHCLNQLSYLPTPPPLILQHLCVYIYIYIYVYVCVYMCIYHKIYIHTYNKTSLNQPIMGTTNWPIQGGGRWRELRCSYGRSFGIQIKRSIQGSGRFVEVVVQRGFTVYKYIFTYIHLCIHIAHIYSMHAYRSWLQIKRSIQGVLDLWRLSFREVLLCIKYIHTYLHTYIHAYTQHTYIAYMHIGLGYK